ncbi:hypothetical protein D3C83_213060 [compost metagenome]
MAVDVNGGSAAFDASSPRALFITPGKKPDITGSRNHYMPSPDGQRFLVATESERQSSVPITVVVDWTAALPAK